MGRRVVLVLGGPGAGKTTLCASLAARWPCVAHVSAGALLREVRGECVRRTLAAGRLVPPGMVCGLVRGALAALPPDRLCLLDGFPREAAGLELWEREGPSPRLVLWLEAAEELRLARCAAREDRGDERAVRVRMRVYREESAPLLDLLAARGVVRLVDAEQAEEAVFSQAVSILCGENLLDNLLE